MSLAIESNLPAATEEKVPRVARIAARFGVTEGQVYTAAIGLVVALVTASIGIPPTLEDRAQPALGSSALAPPSDRASSPPPATQAPQAPSAPAPTYDGVSTTPTSTFGSGIVYDAPGSNSSAPSSSSPQYADGGSLGDAEVLAAVAAPGRPDGVAVDPSTGEFFVATDNADGASKVLRYSAAGSLLGSVTVTDQADADRTHGLTGLALHPDGGVYALDASTARVLRVDVAAGTQDVVAKIPDVPGCTTDPAARCEPSVQDHVPVVRAIVVDGAGTAFISDAGQGIVWRLGEDGSVELWDKAPEYLSPQGLGPAGLAVDPDGNLVLAVTTSLLAFTGAVYRIEVGDDGAAAGRTEVYRSDPNSAPTGVAAGASGRIYVAFAGGATLLVLSPEGEVVKEITSEHLDAPMGLAFRGRSLLVTNQSTDPAKWSVVRVAAEDRGVDAR